jgi:hypothetical protein
MLLTFDVEFCAPCVTLQFQFIYRYSNNKYKMLTTWEAKHQLKYNFRTSIHKIDKFNTIF